MNFIVEILLLFALARYLNVQEYAVVVIAIYVLAKVLVWLFLKFIAGSIKESAMIFKRDIAKRTVKHLEEGN